MRNFIYYRLMFLYFALRACRKRIRGNRLNSKFFVERQNFMRWVCTTNVHAHAKCPVLGDLRAEHLICHLIIRNKNIACHPFCFFVLCMDQEPYNTRKYWIILLLCDMSQSYYVAQSWANVTFGLSVDVFVTDFLYTCFSTLYCKLCATLLFIVGARWFIPIKK